MARRLGRPLVGDPSAPTDEYLLLHLLNSEEREALEELLANHEAHPRIGNDLIAVVSSRLRRGGCESKRPAVECSIPVPALVWDRYAKRAREGHRRVDSVLVDALLREDEWFRQSQQDAVDAREAFREQARELTTKLVTLTAALDAHQAGSVEHDRELKLDAALVELSRQATAQGFAFAAVLRALHDKGWVAKPLVTALKARGWLTE